MPPPTSTGTGTASAATATPTTASATTSAAAPVGHRSIYMFATWIVIFQLIYISQHWY